MNLLKILVVFTAMLTLSLMYAPQPITPLLAEFFGVSLNQISLVISLTLIPLAIAPILYGYLLERFSSIWVLIIASLLCAGFGILGTMCENFSLFLFTRLVQSLCFPAILTALLTLLTRLSSGSIQQNVAIYVGATTFGGFVGRVLGSYLSDVFSWQIALNFFAISMLFCSILFVFFRKVDSLNQGVASLRDYLVILKEKRAIVIFACVFVLFFSLQALMSFLPFHLKDIFPHITQSQIGAVYLGLLSGIFISLSIGKIIIVMRSRQNAIILGFIIFIFGTLGFMTESFIMSFVAMIAFCSGMFICHSLLSAELNSTTSKKGIANGLYLTFYYSGGAIGSIAPGFVYDSFGWNVLCAFIVIFVLSVLLVFVRNKALYAES